jgi:predicted O-methyltransferase YrrM
MTRIEELLQTPRMDVGGTDPLNMLQGLDELLQIVKPDNMVEIGCFHGVSTELFCLRVPHVVAIDPWAGADDTFAGFMKRCEKYFAHVGPAPDWWTLLVIRDASPGALNGVWADTFDFAYIDGNHHFDAVVADILACARVVRPNAYIGGHDFPMPQVAKAVRLLLGEPEKTFSDGSWLCRNKLLQLL